MTSNGPAADQTVTTDERPVEVEVRGTTLRATDIAGNVVSYDVVGWDPLSWSHVVEEPIDGAVTGRASEIRYDLWNAMTIECLDGEVRLADQCQPIADGLLSIGYDEDSRYSLSAGEYFCRCDGEIFSRIRFDSEAVVRNRSFGKLSISFPHPTPVTFAFKSSVEVPQARVVVEPTTTGVASGISQLASSLRTMGPSRVHRSYRGYPPLIAVGSETEIPESVRADRIDTGIELLVPDSLAAVYTAAPMAYFLGATLTPSPGVTPQVRADENDFAYEIPVDPSFGAGVRHVLERTFFLELMVDWLEADDPTVEEYTQLRDEGVTVADCADRPLAERIERYLELPADPVDEVLPEWPYRMTIEPDPTYAPVVSHLLHDLAAIDAPETTMESDASSAVGEESGYAPREQLLAAQELHGGVGDVDCETAFHARPAAYENRLTALERETEAISVTVVTGPDIDSRRAERIASTYAARDETVPTIVDSWTTPTRDALTAILTEGTDFLHYVGSCEGGLACSDGRLDPNSLSGAEVSIVQLDGVGSRDLADGLVSAGAIAVACRDRAVTGRAETIVGDLLLYGQSIATAAQCSHLVRSASTSTTVVGDGTHRFVAKWRPSSVQALSERADGSVSVTVVPFSVDPVGTHWRPEYGATMHLMPSSFTYRVEPSSFNEYLSNNNQPLVTEDGFYLPDEGHQLLYPIA